MTLRSMFAAAAEAAFLVAVFSAAMSVAGSAVSAARSARFTDTSGHPHELAVNIAAERGLYRGYRDGSFRPDRAMTPGQAEAVIGRLVDRYTDDDGVFTLTRAEMAVLLTRDVCWREGSCAPAPPLDRTRLAWPQLLAPGP